MGVGGLKPFFPFYGSKYRLARHYPSPDGRVVVEPFAGSACYSTYYGVDNAILVDADPTISSVWKYLIGATPDEIVALPDLPNEGDSIDGLDAGASALIGFWLTKSSSPVRKRGAYAASDEWRHLFWRPAIKERIAGQLDKIRGWSVVGGDYTQAPMLNEALYFVDPPYEMAGKYYRVKFSDYASLAEWSMALPGPTIVCEGEGAYWLPFSSLGQFKTFASGSAIEKVWISGFS